MSRIIRMKISFHTKNSNLLLTKQSKWNKLHVKREASEHEVVQRFANA